MAIKISNVSVIDNDRNVVNANTTTFTGNTSFNLPSGGAASRPGSPENGMIRYNSDDGTFEGYSGGAWGPLGAGVFVKTPTNTSPANGETNVSINPTLAATSLQHVYNLEKTSGTWQISVTSTFANTELDVTIAGSSNSYSTSANLQYTSTYYWRVKYADGDGNETDFSTPTEFTTQDEPPSVLGEPYGGGYYTGAINIGGGVCYYLIVAPNSTGCSCCQWKTTNTTTAGTTSLVDGYTNTYGPLNNATHNAGNWAATRTIGGYSDWYLPARSELQVMYANRANMPAGQGWAVPPSDTTYFSSTSVDAPSACYVDMSGGGLSSRSKTDLDKVRAVRRISF